jgi:hypothetical protein
LGRCAVEAFAWQSALELHSAQILIDLIELQNGVAAPLDEYTDLQSSELLHDVPVRILHSSL